MLASALALAFLPRSAPLVLFIAIHCAILIAITTAQTASQAQGMSGVAPSSIPHGTAIMSTLIQLGGGFGSAAYATLYATRLAQAPRAGRMAAFDGFHAAFLCGAILLAIPLAMALLPERREASEGRPAKAMAAAPADGQEGTS